MLVEMKDGCCWTCKGQWKIVEASDDTLTVECTACGETDVVETDAFNDGGVHYWPHVMADQMVEEGRQGAD